MIDHGPGPDRLFDPSTGLGRAYEAVDWAATPLGPTDSWSASLRNTVRLMIGSRFSMWMAWGPELVFFCNEKYRLDTLGKKFPWALGRPAAQVWAEIWGDIRSRVDAVVRDGESTWDEGLMLFLERSGYVEETYHTFSYSPLSDDDGSIAGLFCVVSEDTARVVGERRVTVLRDLAAELGGASTETEVAQTAARRLADADRDLPFVLAYDWDGDTARLTWSVGVEGTHRLAASVADVSDPPSPLASLLAGTRSRHLFELGDVDDLPTGGWREPPLQAVALPLRKSEAGAPYGFLVVGLNRYRPFDASYEGFLDLVAGQIAAAAARAGAFEAERTRAEQMAALDRAKTTFFTNVSHELRTPLTLLLGPAEDALSGDGLLPADRERVEVIHRSAERLLKLVNTLLDFSRLESGRTQARYEPVELDRYTAEVASMFESPLQRAGLEFEFRCEPISAPVVVDREMWAKIVLNLLSNALKATYTGGVSVRLDTHDDCARLQVVDTGIGIPETEQAHLFERFHRVSGAVLRSHEGSGIGLALVAELVELHGGRITLESRVGIGSTFTVWIPTGTAHLPPGSVVVEPAAVDASAATKAIGASYLAETMRWTGTDQPVAPLQDEADHRHLVLIADDNADMRDYVRGVLDQDYRVVTAPDGAAALRLAEELKPDLVLTDVMMPVLDGFGLLSALRSGSATMHLPVIMLSARSGDDAAVEGLELGADDYLVKPFSARELRARVRANLELDRVRRLVDELERQKAMLAKAEELAGVGSYEFDVASGRVTGSAEFFHLVATSSQTLLTDGAAAALRRIHPDDLAATTAAYEQSLRSGEPLASEVRVSDDDGTTRVLWITGEVEPDDDGRPARLRGSVQDITDRRRAETATVAAAAAREAERREHAIALELQRSLLPAQTFDVDHLDIATFYQSGVEDTEVGGDWYDVIDLDAGRTALVLGDVMGRGVRAAAVMGQLRATVRAYARLDTAPDLLLHLLDSSVRELRDTIVTCVYAVYDPADRTITYANAGHPPPLLTLPGGVTTRLTSGGPPLGTGRTWSRPERVELVPGAVVTLYTDGLVEKPDGAIDDGIDTLAGLLSAAADPIADRPARLVGALCPDGTDDDIAILMVSVSRDSSSDDAASVELPSDRNVASGAREFVRGWLDARQVPDDVVLDAELVISELATNALRHGQPPIEVSVRRAGERIYLGVTDTGTAPPRMRHASASDAGGRGLLIVSRISERWGTRQTETGKSVWSLLRVRTGTSPRKYTGPRR